MRQRRPLCSTTSPPACTPGSAARFVRAYHVSNSRSVPPSSLLPVSPLADSRRLSAHLRRAVLQHSCAGGALPGSPAACRAIHAGFPGRDIQGVGANVVWSPAAVLALCTARATSITMRSAVIACPRTSRGLKTKKKHYKFCPGFECNALPWRGRARAISAAGHKQCADAHTVGTRVQCIRAVCTAVHHLTC